MEPTDRPGGGLLPRSHMQHPFIEDPVAKENPSSLLASDR
jgi:lysine/ornithine N-monooxygenase